MDREYTADEMSRVTLSGALGNDSTVSERLAALSQLMSPHTLSAAVGVTPEAIRAWGTGASPRRAALRALDNLRCASLTLLEENGVAPQRVESWFTSKPSARSWRPIELIGRDPEAVLAAAVAVSDDRHAIAVRILEEATDRAKARPADQSTEPAGERLSERASEHLRSND